MKFTTAVILAASASMAAAYTNADIPSCAVPCIKEGTPKVGCKVGDVRCSCEKQDDLAAEVIGCISEKCSAEEALKSSTVSDSICADLTSKSSSKSSSSGNSTSAAAETPSSSPTPTPSSSSTNAAGALQAGGMAAGLSAVMGAAMLMI